MGAGGVIDKFRRQVRRAIGLPIDPGQPPDLMRLGLYEARVDVCSSDGSKLDVTPLDKRISPEKNVELRVGIPGAVATVQPGCVVQLGWDRGDPKRPYCVPHWKQGATVTKLVLYAATVYLGDDSGTDALVKKSEFNGHTHTTQVKEGTTAVAGLTSAVPNQQATGTTNVQAK